MSHTRSDYLHITKTRDRTPSLLSQLLSTKGRVSDVTYDSKPIGRSEEVMSEYGSVTHSINTKQVISKLFGG